VQPPVPVVPGAGRAGTAEPAKARAHGVRGVEFPLGQALGGHMRRHRAVLVEGGASARGLALAGAARKADEARGPLSLDLNLPPP
jgi:hypothetical protein